MRARSVSFDGAPDVKVSGNLVFVAPSGFNHNGLRIEFAK